MRTTVWIAGDSFLHRLNPLSKLAACILAAIVVSIALTPTVPILVALLAVLTTRFVGQVPWSAFLRPAIFALIAGFGVFWTASLFYAGGGETLATIGPLRISGAGVHYGATLAARLFAIMASSAMFVLTSEPTQLVRSLIHQLHVSPRIAYSIFAAYRFVPLVEVELDNIRAAHKMRAGAGGGLWAPVRRAAGYAIPLLAIAVRRGERVALAMDSRAFGALPRRTYFRVTTIGAADASFGVASVAVLGALGVYALLQRVNG